MNDRIFVEDLGGSRKLDPAAFPIPIGGPRSAVRLPGIPGDEPLAWIGLHEGALFLQPTSPDAGHVTCNGVVLTTSQWLLDGDVLGIGSSTVVVTDDGARMLLKITDPTPDNNTEPPLLEPPGTPPSPSYGPIIISPTDYSPPDPSGRREPRWRVRPGLALEIIFLLVLAAVVWFVFTARSIELSVTPEPDQVTLRGVLPTVHFGGRYLAHPGDYRVLAEREGYRTLEGRIHVTRQSHQQFRFELERIPGLLVVDSGTVTGAEVLVDGISAGTTPLAGIEVDAGNHTVLVRKKRYQDFVSEVSVEGPGSVRTLVAEMVADWANVTIRSRPAGATVTIGGEQVGRTPVTAEVVAGTHRLEIVLQGYTPYVNRLKVTANEPLTPATVVLQPAEGNLSLRSDPSQATVTLNGEFEGTTPLELDLAPDQEHELEVSKAGYQSNVEHVHIRSGESRQLIVTLQPLHGEVSISSRPPGADVLIDGEVVGVTDQTLSLRAVEHVIEVRKDGYQPFQTRLEPRPGLPQELAVKLQPEAAPGFKDEIQTPQGVPMRLILPGRFTMGASRREPGRRANESLREVELTRPFYLAVREVSNREYRAFDDQHRSGAAGRYSLENDRHPVVRVSWEDAVRYCNWLSEQEGLPPVYVERGSTLTARSPLPTGYRLPTEAEWAWAARVASGPSTLKYSWGDGLPIPKDAGNYGDRSAESLLGGSLNDYDDGNPVTAPVGSFLPNARGLFNMGGNVSEWVNDIYTMYPPSPEAVVSDPVGPSEGEYHVIRGASWMDENVSELRLSFRDYGKDPRPDVGFRIARSAE